MDPLLAQLLVGGIVTGSFYALAAVSWGVIYRTTHIFHFSHHLVFAIGGYTAALLTTEVGLPWFIGLFGAVVAAVIAGCLIEILLYRKLRKKDAKHVNVFLASLGLATAGVALILLIFSSNPRPLTGFPFTLMSLGPAFFTFIDLTIVVSSWVMILLLLWFLSRSVYGKAIVAVGSNEEMAENLGIDADRIFLLVFAIGSALFGAAAFLFTAKNVASPTMGILPFFIAFSAVFLGGINSLFGHALAGLLLGLAENLGMLFLPAEYKTMIAFAILFAVIVVKPTGILSRGRR